MAADARADTAPETTTRDWPGFRGKNGSGVSAAVGLPIRFDAPANSSWSAIVPLGRASPIIQGRRLFFTARDGEQQCPPGRRGMGGPGH